MSGDFMQGDKDNAVAVPFSDDDSDKKPEEGLLDDIPATASVEERITRKRKQEERIKRIVDEGKQNKEEVERLRGEQAQLQRDLAELRATVHRPAPPADGKDPYERELDAIYEKQQEAYTAAQAEIKAGSFNADRQKHYEKIARDIETRKSTIAVQRAIAERAESTRAEQAQQVWVQKYPEVYGNQRAYQYAEASFRRRQALMQPGESVTNAMVDEVMNEAMTQFKLGGRSAPTASQKSRMSGMAASGNTGGNSGPPGITLTPDLKRMAIAAYSELPEAEAIKKWVNTTGKRLREKKVL